MRRRCSDSSARFPTSCGRWTARESIAEEKRPVTRCRFWTITAVMWWDCTVWPRSRPAGLSLRGANVRALRRARGHADGSWQHLVGHPERLWTDVAIGATDRTRDWAAVWASASSADAGESGALPSYAG